MESIIASTRASPGWHQDGSRGPRGSKAATESLWSLSFLGTQAGGVLQSALGGKGGLVWAQCRCHRPVNPDGCTDTLGWKKEIRGRKEMLALAALHAVSGTREGVLTREIYPLWGIKIRFLILAMRPFLFLEVLT